MATSKKKRVSRSKKKKVSRKIHTEVVLQKYGNDKFEEGYRAGKEAGISDLQRKLQDLLGITIELQSIEADIERHRYENYVGVV